MDKEYRNQIIACAEQKLTAAKKPLTENELVRGIVHLLKKSLGREDNRHSAKGRFRRQSFKDVLNTKEWTLRIRQLPQDKKYVLAKDFAVLLPNLDENPLFSGAPDDLLKTKEMLKKVLSKIDPFEFEILAGILMKRTFPDYKYEITKKTGDGGFDGEGTRKDSHNENKIEKIYMQAKRHSKSIGSPDAQKFIGVVSQQAKKNSRISKVTAIFISTSGYSDSAKKVFAEMDALGVTYLIWDGEEVINKIMHFGIGIKYCIDSDFWQKIDTSLVN